MKYHPFAGKRSAIRFALLFVLLSNSFFAAQVGNGQNFSEIIISDISTLISDDHNFNAQIVNGEIKDSTAVISISNGATIFSSDEGFNHQLGNANVLHGAAFFSNESMQGGRYLLVLSKTALPKKEDLQTKLGGARMIKGRDCLKNVQRLITCCKKLVETFSGDLVKNDPSPDHLSKKNIDSRLCLTSRTDHHEDHKAPEGSIVSSFNYTFGHLHISRNYYHGRSRCSCISEGSLVRPPPSQL